MISAELWSKALGKKELLSFLERKGNRLMQYFLLGVWKEKEGHLKQLKRMLCFLASPVFSPYFLFPSAASNLSRVNRSLQCSNISKCMLRTPEEILTRS